jgi:hypothetical protein
MDTEPVPPHAVQAIGLCTPDKRCPVPLQGAQAPENRPVPLQVMQFLSVVIGLLGGLPQPQNNGNEKARRSAATNLGIIVRCDYLCFMGDAR